MNLEEPHDLIFPFKQNFFSFNKRGTSLWDPFSRHKANCQGNTQQLTVCLFKSVFNTVSFLTFLSA